MNASILSQLRSHRPGRARYARFVVVVGVCVACGFLLPLPVHCADGDLDLTFVPDASYPVDALGLGVIDGEYYFSHPVEPDGRLLEDGQLDPDWSLEDSSSMRFITELRRTPSGGWVFSELGSVYLDTGSGAAQRIGFAYSAGGEFQRLFPQSDGWVVIGDPLSRVSEDGTRDPVYGSSASYVAASFNDGAGRSIIGGPSVTLIEDDLNRFIVAGNLKQVGEMERLGLARILPNGHVDPDWDVGSAVGIELDDEGYLNALPISLAAGPENRVVVGLQLVSTNGEPNIRFAVLDGDGNVIATFPNPGLRQPTSPVVQPDGRILIGGTLQAEPNTPLAAVVRLNADGSLDETFEVGISSGSGWVQIWSLALDTKGRLYIAGSFDSVIGVPRPGLARVHAYEPIPEAPSLGLAYHQPRIGTNEFLHLTAGVGGVPEPELQWYLDGAELPGQTHPGLRVLVESAEQVGNYSMVASNSEGTQELQFPAVGLAVRSPRPGVIDPTFQRSLVEFASVTHLLSLSDGSVLVGGGDIYAPTNELRAMVGRLNSEGHLEQGFGNAGVVTGDGFVESLRLLSDGGILVAGQFTELAGVPATGLAELDARGRLVARDWPVLDVAHVSTALRQPDGRYVLAGKFSTVAGESAYRLARLDDDLTLDETFTSPLEPWQFVDDLDLDSEGRLLIAGERIYAVEPMTNAPPLGLRRLQEDGSPEPGFQRFEGPVRDVVVESSGDLLTLTQAGSHWSGYTAPCRLAADGALLVEYEAAKFSGTGLRAMLPDHRLLRMPDGSVVGTLSTHSDHQLIRWQSSGRLDFNFSSVIGTNAAGPVVQAVALLPDGALLVSTLESSTLANPLPPEQARRLMRIPPDSDARLQIVDLGGGELRVQISTQPGKTYQIRSRTSLESVEPTLVGVIAGDGYVQELRIPVEGSVQFLDYVGLIVRPW